MAAFDLADLDRQAARQGGLVLRPQVSALGVPDASIDRWLRSGRLRHTERPGIYVVCGAPDDDLRAVRVALAAVGHDALVAHASAIRAWGLWGSPGGLGSSSPNGRVHILVAERAQAEVPGVRIHHTRRLLDAERALVRGVPVTSVARSICDVAGSVTPATVADLVADACSRSLLTPGDLHLSVEARRRFPGRRAVRAALLRLTPDQERYRSKLERRARDALVGAGLPAPRVNHPVLDRDGRVRLLDLAWPEARVAAEVDGPHHAAPSQQRRDATRTLAIEGQGWTVDRFTPDDVTSGALIEVVRSRLAERRHPALR